MNTPPVSAGTLSGASARVAERSSESTAAAGGFAALFAQLEPVDAPSGVALRAAAAADDDALPREEATPAEGPDPTLLAALGLSPLPPLPIAAGPVLPGLSAWSGPLTGSGSTPSGETADAASAGSLAAARTSAIPAASAAPLASLAEALPLVAVAAAATHPPAPTAPASAPMFDNATPLQALAGGVLASTAGGVAGALNAPLADPSARAAEPITALGTSASTGNTTTVSIALATARTPEPAADAGRDDSPLNTAPAQPALAPAAPRAAADFSSSPAAPSAAAGPLAAAPDPALALGAEAGPEALLASLGRAEALLTARRSALDANTGGAPLAAAAGAERAELAASLRESLLPPSAALPMARLEPGAPQFSATLSQQMLWMASQQVSRAELKLSPDELGPLEISVEMNGDEIRAEFASRSAEVRSLLETQIPRLRELLAEQGFSLADAQVGQERAAYQDAPQQREGFAQRNTGEGGAEQSSGTDAPAAVAHRRHNGLIDDFA
jgi:flagellar hook-length control protein FliK